jgi:hypothetical protein
MKKSAPVIFHTGSVIFLQSDFICLENQRSFPIYLYYFARDILPRALPHLLAVYLP